MAQTLLDAGFSKDEVNAYIDRIRVAIAKALFNAGARLDALHEVTQEQLLGTAIETGNIALVKLLIGHGASVTAKILVHTPTELAKAYGQEAVYQLLIARGGTPVDNKSSAQLALGRSAEEGDIPAMERAIASGARVNGEGPADKRTALNIAVGVPIYERSQAEAIWWLLDHGADPNFEDEGHFGLPLHHFIYSSVFPLSHARKWDKETLELLRRRTGKLLSEDTVKALNEETLVRLLKAGARVSGIDRKIGWTPLHVAARFDNLMAAQILIREGAKVMPRDSSGKTPLDYAESGAMIRLLKQSGATER